MSSQPPGPGTWHRSGTALNRTRLSHRRNSCRRTRRRSDTGGCCRYPRTLHRSGITRRGARLCAEPRRCTKPFPRRTLCPSNQADIRTDTGSVIVCTSHRFHTAVVCHRHHHTSPLATRSFYPCTRTRNGTYSIYHDPYTCRCFHTVMNRIRLFSFDSLIPCTYDK